MPAYRWICFLLLNNFYCKEILEHLLEIFSTFFNEVYFCIWSESRHGWQTNFSISLFQFQVTLKYCLPALISLSDNTYRIYTPGVSSFIPLSEPSYLHLFLSFIWKWPAFIVYLLRKDSQHFHFKVSLSLFYISQDAVFIVY